MHGSALVFMILFWALVLGLVVFVFCRLYCPTEKALNHPLSRERGFSEEPDEVT